MGPYPPVAPHSSINALARHYPRRHCEPQTAFGGDSRKKAEDLNSDASASKRPSWALRTCTAGIPAGSGGQRKKLHDGATVPVRNTGMGRFEALASELKSSAFFCESPPPSNPVLFTPENAPDVRAVAP